MQDLVPRFKSYHPDVKRTKVRYGPYTLPSIKSTTVISMISGEQGKMAAIAMTMKKPCSNCGLITAQAGLEYPNGEEANTSNGAWLHHIVMVTNGPGRRDNVCGRWVLPGERFFSSGNERTPTAFGDVLNSTIKSVFPLTPSDVFSSQLELMNLDHVVKRVYLTVDWEYIPGPRPADFKIAKAMWLDVTNCGISSISPPRGQTQFSLHSSPWTSSFNGEMLGVGGHLHDGGTDLDITVNDKIICNSLPRYAVGGGHGGHKRRSIDHRNLRRDGPPAKGRAHIAEMSTCSMMGSLMKGDRVKIEAKYNFKKHEGFKSKTGGYVDVMGIAILYAAAEPSS